MTDKDDEKEFLDTQVAKVKDCFMDIYRWHELSCHSNCDIVMSRGVENYEKTNGKILSIECSNGQNGHGQRAYCELILNENSLRALKKLLHDVEIEDENRFIGLS